MATRRKNLCGHRARGKKLIDIEDVYKKIDAGQSLEQIAADLDVSVTTLYRRHQEWQEKIVLLGEDFDTIKEEDSIIVDEDDILPIDEDYRI